MAAIGKEKILSVRHWNDTLFSFTATRDPALRFENGHFVMIGLEVNGKPLMRAYSIASANYEENLEFFSIKVQNGPLTSRLQHLKVGDELLVSRKPTGTLVLHDLKPGKHLYMLSDRHRPRAVFESGERPGNLRALRQDRADPRRALRQRTGLRRVLPAGAARARIPRRTGQGES
jgi:hypothetical protein